MSAIRLAYLRELLLSKRFNTVVDFVMPVDGLQPATSQSQNAYSVRRLIFQPLYPLLGLLGVVRAKQIDNSTRHTEGSPVKRIA